MLQQIFLDTPIVSISFTIVVYVLSFYVCKFLYYIKIKFIPPIMISVILIVAFLKIFNVSYEAYNEGARFITYFSIAATTTLALHVYRRKEILKKYYPIILLSISVGVFFGFISTFIIALILFNLDYKIVISLLAKSITTPIAIDFTNKFNGIPSITALAVFISATFGTTTSLYIYKIFKIKSPIAKGLGLGTSSHALGTAYAIGLGQTEASMSSLALTLAAIISVIFMPLLLKLCTIIFSIGM